MYTIEIEWGPGVGGGEYIFQMLNKTNYTYKTFLHRPSIIKTGAICRQANRIQHILIKGVHRAVHMAQVLARLYFTNKFHSR
jgi:hypothetical protein